MRDPADTATAELPTIPPLPPKPVRVTIAMRRISSVYWSPRERLDCCRTCRHAHEILLNTGTYHESSTVRCGNGNGDVSKGGICAEHEE